MSTKEVQLTHSAVRNEAKEVTGYAIKADGILVGTAVKNKSKFDFTPEPGAGKPLTEIATMKSLKEEVSGNLSSKFVSDAKAAAKPAAVPKSSKTQSPEQKAAMEAAAVEAAAAGSDEDINLD